MGQTPLVAECAFQDELIDADGNRYIDYCGSWGALIHGHAHPDILAAVKARMDKGTSFGITTKIEGEIASEIVGLIDSVEKIRFVSSGTEATMTAVRLARGYTNRDIIVKFSGNYHGHTDYFLVEAGSGVLEVSPTASSDGVPADSVKHTINLPYNDIEACRKLFFDPDYCNRIAAVILEPIAANMGVVPATHAFIHFLRSATQEIGALLIFDEVVTGFRVGLKGAQDYFAVKPDLTCFGKIIGGGFPAAAFGGRQEIMDHLAPLGKVYQAGTLSGNPVAMEAGLQSLKLLKRPGFYDELQSKTNLLLDPIRKRIKEKDWDICIQQIGSMFTIFFGKKQVDNLKDALEINSGLFVNFFQYLFKQGIYIPPSPHEAWFVSQSHSEDHLIFTKNVILEFLERTHS
jgi:glutamate-1-semialdehyde 2,1-aminomutase